MVLRFWVRQASFCGEKGASRRCYNAKNSRRVIDLGHFEKTYLFKPPHLNNYTSNSYADYSTEFSVFQMFIAARGAQPFTQRRLLSNTEILSIREQTENASRIQIISAISIEDLPKIKLGDRTFVLKAHTYTKRSRHSWVWQHGTALMELPKKGVEWNCNACDASNHPRLYSAATTSTAERHLNKKHGLKRQKRASETESSEKKEKPSQERIDKIISRANKRVKFNNIRQPKGLVNRFKVTLLAWIISFQIAFVIVKNDFFKNLIVIVSPQLAAFFLTGNTIRAWIITEFETRKTRLKEQLSKDSVGIIHISFDL
jgi:hypothetical protein